MENYDTVFNWIFNSLEILWNNWNWNFKKINSNIIYKNNQIIYWFNFSNYKLCSLKFEFLIYHNIDNKINVISKNIYIKNIIQNQSSIIESYKEIYNEMEFVEIEYRLDNNKFEIYWVCNDVWKLQNVFISGIIMNHFTI